MNVFLQLKRRLSRRALLCFYGAVLIAMSVALVSAGLWHKHRADGPTRARASVPAARSSEPDIPDLIIDRVIQHGHIVEIQARVQPGTTVMVNGQRAAVIWGEGEIKHFVGPLPDGINEIAVTVQNDAGGTNTKQLSVSLP